MGCENIQKRFLLESETGRSKLAEKEVIFIRTKCHKMNRLQIAQKFMVSRSLIGQILNREIWKHLLRL
jgi:hypothetical protein